MKYITKIILTSIFMLITTWAFSQVNTVINNMTYINGTPISNCGTIDFEANSTVRVQFTVDLDKPVNQVVGDGVVYVYTKKTSSSYPQEERVYSMPSSFWNNNTQTGRSTYTWSPDVELDANNFNTTGGVLYTIYKSSSNIEYSTPCNYSIEKDVVPSFNLSPISTLVSCGNNSPKTFTITPSNIPSSATVTYQWSVGSGWLRNGNPVSNFTTTTTSVTLVPNAYPPSNVNVTPILNGNSYPQLTSTVSLSNINPALQITGNSNVCNSEIYSVGNLPSGTSIQSVNSSNTNIATATLETNGDITVTKISDGIATLSVVIQNTCSQTKTLTKQIQIGIPASVFNATITGASSICQGQSYTYTLSGANHPCISSIVWNTSSNLTIVSQNSNSITVTKNPFGTEYAGVITASIPGSTVEISKGVWVGVPSNDGLVIQKIGSYDLYAGSWTKLRARYIPLMYIANDPLDITFEWQIPNSMIRNYADTAYKDVKPINSGQLNIGVRVNCECGNGEWKYRQFNVGGGSSGNGPIELMEAD